VAGVGGGVGALLTLECCLGGPLGAFGLPERLGRLRLGNFEIAEGVLLA
jgi:hypothetical protein